jgi:C4-dicarboxylate-specific signal transduction histidine kinase
MEARIKLLNKVSNEDVLETIKNSNHILKYMSTTIDDFKNFFTQNKIKEKFYISEQIELAINMIKNTISSNNIKVEIVLKNNLQISGCKNEFLQVLINLLANAKDAIAAKGIKNGKITIKIFKKENLSVLEIDDNGIGIDTTTIDQIFEPFFTFNKKNGTGIGLFISKLIIENNMNGKLTAQNIKNGARFRITI